MHGYKPQVRIFVKAQLPAYRNNGSREARLQAQFDQTSSTISIVTDGKVDEFRPRIIFLVR